MDVALKYLVSRPRTIREVERHLDEKQYGEYEVQQVVDRLIELGYLNDQAYAQEFVRSRLATKPVSRQKLYQQLSNHELPKDIILAALEQVPKEQEEENALAVAKKVAAQLERGNISAEEANVRMMRRLLGRGYSYEDARKAVCALEYDNDKGSED